MSTENKPVKKNDLIVSVTNQVSQLRESGEIVLPNNYSAENALKSAWMQLSETKDKNGVAICDSCTPVSVSRALMKMVTQGMNPIKNQCYFIAYGNQLNFQRSYQGNIAMAKRVGDVKSVNANVIFEGDKYEVTIDKFGVKNLVSHLSDFANRDDNKIIGAYAIVVFNDNSTQLEDMSMLEIKKSWAQGATKGASPAHQNFKGEMAKKTVINRALKTIINSSSDSDLYEDDEMNATPQGPSIPSTANKETLTFDEHEEVKEETKSIENNAPGPIKTETEKVKAAKPEKESKELFDRDAGF